MTIEQLQEKLDEHIQWLKDNNFIEYTCVWPDCKNIFYSIWNLGYPVCPDCRKFHR